MCVWCLDQDVDDLKDLIDDNPIEEESDPDSDDSHSRTKRKKSDDELDDRLDDEDYELIEENLGVPVERKVINTISPEPLLIVFRHILQFIYKFFRFKINFVTFVT